VLIMPHLLLVMASATTWGAWRRSQLQKLSACCCSLQNTTLRPFTLRARLRHALHTGASQQVPGVSGGQLSHTS